MPRAALLTVLGVAVVLLLLLAARHLTADRVRVSAVTGARPLLFVADVPPEGGEVCQTGAHIPVNTAAVQLVAGTLGKPGPPLSLEVRKDGLVVATGRVRRGWVEGDLAVSLAFRGSTGDATDATICLRSTGGTRVTFAGEPDGTFATIDGQPARGKLGLLARAREPKSVADLLPVFRRRIGFGNAGWIGAWTVWAIGLLVTSGAALGAIAIAATDGFAKKRPPPQRRQVLFRGIPLAGRALVGASLAVGMGWAFLTPPFQVPDEISHVAYVQYLSESGRLPRERPGTPPYSAEERAVLGAVGFYRIIGRSNEKVLSTADAEADLRRLERQEFQRGDGNATTASANPPLYYLLQMPVFLATAKASLLTQILAMRFLSVCLLSGSVLFAFLFVREMMPGSPWAWTAGGLASAFQPVLGFVSSGVNPDSLLFLSATALFFGVARMLRRGLTIRRASAVAIALAAGLLTKPLFFALAPVALVGLGLAALRAHHSWLRPCVIAAMLVIGPVAIAVVIADTVYDHPYFAVAAAVASGPDVATDSSLAKQASFMLQLFLPRLPFLNDQIPGVPIQDIWIAGLVGVFGWVDYGFGAQTNALGDRVFLTLLVLLSVAMMRYRRTVRAQWPLLICCLLGLVLVPAAVGIVDYQAFATGSARFEQARYLLPLLGLYAALFGISVKAVGPRLGLLLLPVLWVLLSLHTFAAMVLTVNRYYL